MTSVSITHRRSDKITLIDVDGRRLERVVSYCLSQEACHHPVVEIVQHDEQRQEFSRTFVPTTLVLRTV